MRMTFACNVLTIAATALIAAASLTPDAVLAQERPYKATLDGLAVGFPEGVYTASGTATHSGNFSEFGSYAVVEFVGPGLAHLVGEATQIAANGDILTYTFDEIVDFNTEPFTAAGTFTITGGTGRFTDATGGGTFGTVGAFGEEGLDLTIKYSGTIDY